METAGGKTVVFTGAVVIVRAAAWLAAVRYQTKIDSTLEAKLLVRRTSAVYLMRARLSGWVPAF